MVRVKICGLTREEDVIAAVNAGADALGFISGFPRSPRNLPLKSIQGLANLAPPFVDTVLVTTTKVLSEERQGVQAVKPSALQLYGELSDATKLKNALHVKLIRPHPVGDHSFKSLPDVGYDALLSETSADGHLGGTGTAPNWDDCRQLRDLVEPLPFVLSGGLKVENVEDAIRKVEPFAVDVSSGVEASPGKKDHDKLKEFVRKASHL